MLSPGLRFTAPSSCAWSCLAVSAAPAPLDALEPAPVLPEPVWPGRRAPSAAASETPATTANANDGCDHGTRRRNGSGSGRGRASTPSRIARIVAAARSGVVVMQLPVRVVVDVARRPLRLQVIERSQEKVALVLERLGVGTRIEVAHRWSVRRRIDSTRRRSASVACKRGSRRQRRRAMTSPPSPRRTRRRGAPTRSARCLWLRA